MFKLRLQMFAEDGSATAPETAAAETATGAAETTPGPVTAGDQLADGTTVKNAQVAAALEKQMKRHPNLRAVYGQNRGNAMNADAQGGARANANQGAGAPQQAGTPGAEQTLAERWEAAKKGEFAEMYGNDVRKAVTERFRNQEDANGKLNALEPMLKVMRERAGVGTNEELVQKVLDDDSLYEEAANEAGMTIPAYKQFMQLKAERDAQQQREEQNARQERIHQHYSGLVKQAEALKANFPDFDLPSEIRNNPAFARLTSPEVGVSVEDAYFATHHKELAPQMMAYGMQRARTQMGQTMQARQQRPAEGAMTPQSQAAADIKIDPTKLTRKEREEIKRQVRMNKRISFD